MKKLIASVSFAILIFIFHKLFYEDDQYTLEKSHILKEAQRHTEDDVDHKFQLPLKVVGLILARGGSKGIPKKNLARVGNLTLLGRSLKSINEFGRFDSVWVSTDDKEIAEEAERWGAKVHWRSSESATDTASSMIGVEDFLAHHGDVDVIALVQCTSPFLSPLFLMQAHVLVLNDKYDTVFAATRSHHLRWHQDIGKFCFEYFRKAQTHVPF
ncbi:N-acylneuraminate cytidylyltransferase [Schistocerca piceifrons]|uniref:N-acylneuraminate cytidylyltransferase n=1 Tax=Schistocerca piceifrons TaxID=274613 RepID=UPI001F5F7B33|nr:N-acylneuraminate cytidylyltransferase [Schistocerca piceifrons]